MEAKGLLLERESDGNLELFGVDVLMDGKFELTLCFEHLGAL